MAAFVFSVIDESDNIINGTLNAPSVDVAKMRLTKVYKQVLSIREKEIAASTSLPVAFRHTPRVKKEDLAVYCRQMAVMVQAGISINRALRFCAQGENQNLNLVMNRAADAVESGKSLSQALSDQATVFGQVFIALVKAGETSGSLDVALGKLSDLLEKQVTMQKRVQSTLAYPAVIGVVCVAVVCFFVFYIMPMMIPMFTGMGVQLPPTTRFLIWSTETLRNPVVAVPLGVTLAVGVGLATTFANNLSRTPELRYQVDTFLLRIPVLGELLHLAASARVLYTMATLLDAGVALAEVLSTTERVANNEVVGRRIKAAREALLSGASVFRSFEMYEVFAPMALQMIKVGEETGTLSDMVRRVGRLYEDEVDHQLDTLASLIEPLIMAVMGLVVGFITISSFLPMVQLLNNL